MNKWCSCVWFECIYTVASLHVRKLATVSLHVGTYTCACYLNRAHSSLPTPQVTTSGLLASFGLGGPLVAGSLPLGAGWMEEMKCHVSNGVVV